MADLATSPETERGSIVSALGAESTHEFARYFVASLAALAVDAGFLWAFTEHIGLHYLLSGALSFTMGLIVIYGLSVTWVFSHRRVHSPVLEFAVFAGVGLIGLLLNGLALWFFTSVLGLYYLLSKALSVVIVFTWNFAARKRALFA